MSETSDLGIRNRIHKTLQQGKAVAFVGWREAFHDDFTRSIPPERVLFTNNNPPDSVGFVFFTTVVNVDDRIRISRNRPSSQTLLEHTRVRKLLAECNQELLQAAASKTEKNAEDEAGASEALDLLTMPQRLGKDEMFVRAFREAALRRDGVVSTHELSALIHEHEMPAVRQLLVDGWVLAEKAPGRERIGWYRAGPKMQEIEKRAAILPEDPFERARFILSREELLLNEKMTLEVRLDEIRASLEKIENLKRLMGQMSTLLK